MMLSTSSATTPASRCGGCVSASLPEPRRKRHLLIPIAYHRHDGRTVWIDPVVLRAITISWNEIIIPVRHYNRRDDKPQTLWLSNELCRHRLQLARNRHH